MRRLILMRHAKSDWGHPAPSDHDRPLNKRGTRSALALGEWLARQGYVPDEVLCSTATRTRQTLAGLDLAGTVPVQYLRGLYLAETGDMIASLRGAQGSCVLMLAHNPGIAFCAQELLATRPDEARFDDYPTGATTVIDFEIESWSDLRPHTGHLVDFILPRRLPGMKEA